MATPSQILSTILTAELKVANLVDANIVALQGGIISTKWGLITSGTRAIKSVSRQYALGDYTSSQFLTAYVCLCDFVGIYGAGAIDPNAQGGGVVVVTTPVLQNFNSDKIPFATTDLNPQLILANYNLNYLALYGNNPDLAVYITSSDFTQDEQTPPTITYATPGDETSNITQILWDFPLGTTGYLQISGIGSTSTGTPTGGGVVPIMFTYTQADLLLDGFGGYYLPLVLPGTRKPFYASINGDSIPLNYSASTSRFNGFANNLPTQVIQISLM